MTECINCGKRISWEEASANDYNCACCAKKIEKAEQAEAKERADQEKAEAKEAKRRAKMTDEEKAQENADEIAANMAKDIKGAIPVIKSMGQVALDNKEDILEALAPVAGMLGVLYKEMLVNTVTTSAELRAQAIDETIQALVDRGYSKEDAIHLVTKC